MRRRRTAASREQRPQFLALERAELELERRSRATDPVGKPAHALGRGELIRAVRREQQQPPLGEVMREKDDEIERRRIGPVQILEHEQHGRGGGEATEERERLLEHTQLRACGPDLRKPGQRALAVTSSPRAQRLGERLVRQLGAYEVDAAPDEHLESRGSGARRQLGGEPALADPRLAGHQDRRADSRLRPAKRTFETLELLGAPDERRGLHQPPVSLPWTARGRLRGPIGRAG